jgi:hypothetical protein
MLVSMPLVEEQRLKEMHTPNQMSTRRAKPNFDAACRSPNYCIDSPVLDPTSVASALPYQSDGCSRYPTFSMFVSLVADGWCWFVLREKYCWLVAGG